MTTIKGMGSNLLSQLFSFSQRGDQVVVGKHIENVSYGSDMKTILFVLCIPSTFLSYWFVSGYSIVDDVL